jgi:hypothetical protein
MAIVDIVSLIRDHNDDKKAKQKHPDSYYTEKIISAFGDLEFLLGKLSVRIDKFQFVPMRGSDKEIIYQDDGVTPEIDPDFFYNPDDPESADTHIPVDMIVNKGLSVKSGASFATIETAQFLGKDGLELYEPDIALIKIGVLASEDAVYTLDVSFDGRESWIVADYGKEIAIDNGSSGFIDVSDIPSNEVALKWRITAGTIKSTVFERYYIPDSTLRHYAHAVAELAYARILDIEYKKAIENQNDPLVINGIKSQIDSIRLRYGIGKNKGNTKENSGSPQAAIYYPPSREEDKIFEGVGSDLLTANGIISIKSNGEIRRS